MLELIVVTAMLALGAAWLAPALTRTRPHSRSFQCLNNARQLAASFALYAADNQTFYPPNPDDGNTVSGHNWCTGQAGGGTGPSDPPSSDTFNPDNLVNRLKTVVTPYVNCDPRVFRCPADLRVGRYSGPNSSMSGRTMPAARSVSLNDAVGTVCATFRGGAGHSGRPTLVTDGPWLTGLHGENRHDNPWATFGKTTDFRTVSPSQIFLLVDEDPYSINDSHFAVSAGTAKWVDYPAAWHERGATFSFCDGRAQLHQWKGTAVLLSAPASRMALATAPDDYADWSWLRDHATKLMR